MGVAKGLKVPCLFMITEVSIRCHVYGVYPRIPPNTPLVAALLRVARVTAGLAESNGSLPPGL